MGRPGMGDVKEDSPDVCVEDTEGSGHAVMFDNVRAALAVSHSCGGEVVPLVLREQWKGEDMGGEVDREGEDGWPGSP